MRQNDATAPVTTLASWARAIGKALDAAGVDSAALLRNAGIDPRTLADPNARCPQAQLLRLWQLAVQATRDEAFGLRVSQHIGATTFHALGYAVIASATLREVFERCVRYQHVVSNAVTLHLEAIGDEYHLRCELLNPATAPTPESMDAFAAIWLRTCRSRVGAAYAPRRIYLRRRAPADARPFEALFRAPITYGAAEDRLVFDRATFDRPLDDANAELAQHNEQVLQRALAQIDQADIGKRVRTALREQLRHGEPSAAKLATTLHMSLRTLQRRLADIGSSYETVLNDCRRELAHEYLADPRHSISAVAFLLGFSDTSSFTRAFRRWYGCAPSEYRSAASAP